jgi:hypothetical protein
MPVVNSTLYFIRRDSDGAIKIGITTALRRRLSDLRRQYGDMTLLGTVVGASTREKLAHLIFEDSRLDGEFFQPTSGLLSFLAQYAVSPPTMHDKPLKGKALRASHTRPWIDLYSDPLAVYDREQFIRDYERWIARRLVSSEKRRYVEIFCSFPKQIIFVPQPGLSGWGWTPLNPRCWTDLNGRRLYEG